MNYNIFIFFLAGLILNFMPCSLLFLSIKILSILKYNYSAIKTKLAFLSISIGMILTFLVFALFSIILKSVGKSFGIGIHLQNPYFLVFIITILFLLIITPQNFFENIYNILCKITNRKKQNTHDNIIITSFFSGVFGVIFAMSCSFPLIGSLITLSLFESYFNIIILFLFIGLGMVSPFLILSFFPKAIKFVPKNGKWNYILTKISNIIIFTVILWLLYVLCDITGKLPAFLVSCFLALLYIQFKLIKKPLNNIIMIVIITFSNMIFPINIFNEKEAIKISDSIWEKFEISKIEKYLNEDKIVFVAITADWCAVCNINQITTFNKPKIIKVLQNKKVVALKGEVTKENLEVNSFLKKQDVAAIPLYMVFDKNNPNGVKIFGLVSPNKILKKININ